MSHVYCRCLVVVLMGTGATSAAEPVAVRTAEGLKANLGKTITARGVWSDRGKFGSYLTIDDGETVQISGTPDQKNRLYGLWDEHRVRIVGTLRYFEIPAAKRRAITAKYGATVAVPADYYYIDIEDLRVEDESHPDLGLQWARHQPTRSGYPFMLYETWRPIGAEPRAVSAVVISLCEPTAEDRARMTPHTDGFVSVYVNPTGREQYVNGAKELPRGTVIVKAKRHAKAGGEQAELGVMIKRDTGFDPAGGDWEFLFVDKAKKVIYERAETLNCRMCHAARSSRDFVFREGVVRPSGR